ncbi:MAG: biopolymer transporter ExbD [Armatimonadetes bacterium]|nr:biopolymer transporter ExbD [Armatimonadota bacterium]
MRAARRNRHARRDQLITQINFIPFTDVLLVLLVIFMMAAHFLGTEAGLDLRLPAVASAQTREQPLEGVVVTILADGRLYIDEKQTEEADLVRDLAQTATRKHTRLVIVRADRAVAYERVARTIDAAKLAGLNDLALATELDLGQRPEHAPVEAD